MNASAALDAKKRRIIEAQGRAIETGKFYLAGGSALALRLGHRVSEDLDWFTAEEFDSEKLRRVLERAPEKPSFIEQSSPQTLRAYYGTFETSFIFYNQVEAASEQIAVTPRLSVPVAPLDLLAVMKAAAAHDRGAKRDIIDIYAICQQPGWSVRRFVKLAAEKLPLSERQVALSISYFDDADKQPMPAKCSLKWADVKKQLLRDVRALDRDVLER
jgi:hypothetical protein